MEQGGTFTMDGAREILALTGGAILIERQIEAIELNVHGNPSLAIDLSKALVETICNTILADRGISPEKDKPSMNDLANHVLNAVQLGSGYQPNEAEVVKKIRSVAKGLISAVQGIGELRNSQGFASHGPDGYMKSLDPVQALFAARSADALAHFLYKAHQLYGGDIVREHGQPTQMDLHKKRISVDLSVRPDFNDHVDDANEPVQIFDLEFAPSEVLAKVDPKAYFSYLDEFQQNGGNS